MIITIENMAFWHSLVSFALIIVMKIVCFILGYLTIRLGYKLIAAGVKGEFKFSADFAGVKADLVSVSPGLLFVVFGIFLISYAIYVEKEATFEIQSNKTIEKPQLTPQVEGDDPLGLKKNGGQGNEKLSNSQSPLEEIRN